MPDSEDRLADKSYVGRQLQPQRVQQRNYQKSNNTIANNNGLNTNRNKLIKEQSGAYFALGSKFEADSVLEWFAKSNLELSDQQLPYRWPQQTCRLCRLTSNDSNNQTTRTDQFTLDTQRPASEPICSELLEESQLTKWIRSGVFILQSLCVYLTIVLIAILLRLRKSRVIIVSGWLMLETTLLGALLLYLGVLVRSFEATSITCLLEPWLRELGFSIFYGSILIKLYKILTEFQTRKAHRVCLRDKDQMVYLLAIVLIVVGYMSAWTALMVDGFFLTQQTHQSDEDTSLEVSELPFLNKVQMRFARQVQSAGSDLGNLSSLYSQANNIHPPDLNKNLNYSGKTISLLLKSSLSVEQLPEQLKTFVRSLNTFSDLFSGLLEADQQYDATSDYLTYSMRCRKLTWDYVTELSEMGLLLFGIYLIYKLRNASSEVHKEKLVLSAAIFIELFISALTYAIRHTFWSDLSSQQMLLLYCLRCHMTVTLTVSLIFGPKAMLSNSALDIGSINLADMDPDEIQTELKRVYSQLEVLKTKVMRRDNPHISKRRGGRKQGHRKFSLQAFHAKHIAGAMSHHNNPANSSQTSTDTADSNTLNNHNQQEQMAAGKKLPVLLEHETNEELMDSSGNVESLQKLELRTTNTKGGEHHQRSIARLESPTKVKTNQKQPLNNHPTPQLKATSNQTAKSRARPNSSAEPVSNSSSNVYFDDDTLIMNDSPSSEKASTQRQSSFVCSQSSIHPEESSANY